MKPIQAAVVQAAPVVFDTARTLAKLADLAADAARQGAKLAVFPEAFVSAYPKGLDFGARVGQRTPEGREMFRRYFDSAIDVPGPATELIGRAARAGGLHLVVGVIERDGGTLYCTVLFFGPDGSLLGKHRKLMPTAMERLVWGFGDGSTLTAIDTALGRMGSVICWENYMPLLRMAMYAKGVQLYCAPTADDRDTWLSSMRHVALEGRCFVLSACQYLTRGDCPADYPAMQGDDPTTVLMRGGSSIVGPLGQVLAGPNFAGECVLSAELDLNEIARGKFDFDVSGHYARPDVFQLTVDETPRPAVVARSQDVPLPFVSHAEETPNEAFAWGTLKWVCNDKLSAGAAQTVGVCHIVPGGRNPLHYHPNCEEVLHMVAGQGRHSFDGQQIELRPGSTIRIPAGVRHNLENSSTETLVCLITFSSGHRETVFLE